jgi:AcrR family transcriptional regulator
MKKAKEAIVRRQPGRPGRDEPDGALLLLREAQTAFASSGFNATTLRGIAAAAGVDHTLVIHHFGSKESLWSAVIERLAHYLAPFVRDLKDLQSQTSIPIRMRIETAFRLLVTANFGEPDCGLLLSRISSERGKHLDLLVEMLLRPYHDALCPLLVEAVQAKVIKKQGVELLYFMIINAVTTSVSYRHLLAYFDDSSQNLAQLEKDMTQFLVVNFLDDRPSDGHKGSVRTQQMHSRMSG